MDVSIMLAKIFGICWLVAGFALLLNRKFYGKAVKDFIKSPSVLMLSGILELLIGLLIVSMHNIWTGWPVIITVMGWLMIIESTLYLLFPQVLKDWKKAMVSRNFWMAFTILSLVLGVVLIYFGFSGLK